MIEKDSTSGLRIVIPVSSTNELTKYERSLLALLRRIEIGDCDTTLKENLKTVYELLAHLTSERNSLKHKCQSSAENSQQKKQPIQS